MISKKTVISRVFIYAFSLIVAAIIIFIAYNGIKQIIETRCEAQTINALKKIEEDFSAIGYGEYKKYRVPFVCKASRLCFINKSSTGLSGLNYNTSLVNIVYLEIDRSVVQTYHIEELYVKNSTGVLCIDASNPYIWIRGLGYGVQVESKID